MFDQQNLASIEIASLLPPPHAEPGQGLEADVATLTDLAYDVDGVFADSNGKMEDSKSMQFVDPAVVLMHNRVSETTSYE